MRKSKAGAANEDIISGNSGNCSVVKMGYMHRGMFRQYGDPIGLLSLNKDK
jgi:hypothetical protein